MMGLPPTLDNIWHSSYEKNNSKRDLCNCKDVTSINKFFREHKMWNTYPHTMQDMDKLILDVHLTYYYNLRWYTVNSDPLSLLFPHLSSPNSNSYPPIHSSTFPKLKDHLFMYKFTFTWKCRLHPKRITNMLSALSDKFIFLCNDQ